jgi:hypothetical protein
LKWTARLAALTLAAPIRCGGEPQVSTHLSKIYDGFVANVDTNVQIVAFCATTDVAPAIAIRTARGTHVVEQFTYDERKLSYAGPPNPPPDTAFWCGGGGESTHAMSGSYNKCLRVEGADPPATLDRAEDRGEVRSDGTSTGYALYLTVQHAGVLQIRTDPACVQSVYGRPFSDPQVRDELTISLE